MVVAGCACKNATTMNVEGKKKFDGIGYRVSDETNTEIESGLKKTFLDRMRPTLH